MHDKYKHRFTSDFAFAMVNLCASYREEYRGSIELDFDDWTLMYVGGGEL